MLSSVGSPSGPKSAAAGRERVLSQCKRLVEAAEFAITVGQVVCARKGRSIGWPQ